MTLSLKAFIVYLKERQNSLQVILDKEDYSNIEKIINKYKSITPMYIFPERISQQIISIRIYHNKGDYRTRNAKINKLLTSCKECYKSKIIDILKNYGIDSFKEN